MRRSASLLLLMGVLGAGPVGRAAPLATYYYPCGIQAGTTNRVVVGGQYLGGLRAGWVSGDGVEVLDVQRVPRFPLPLGDGQSPWVGAWLEAVLDGRPQDKPPLPSDAALRGWSRHPWWEAMDKLDALELSILARDHYTRRDPLQMSPALSEMSILTVAARADARPGLRDVVLWDAQGASAPHPFFVTKEPRVAERLFESPGQRRKRLDAEARRTDEKPGHPLPVVFDGQIMPGETDAFRLHLLKGCRLVCTLLGRELLPYLGDAVPGFFNPVLHLKDAYGHEVACADDFHFLPDPVLVYDVPSAGDYVLEVHDNVYRGRQDFVYAVSCRAAAPGEADPSPRDLAFACFPPAPAHIPPAEGSWQGVVDCPGRSVGFEFEVREPATWSFDLFARRIGSPLDGVLRLYGPMTSLPLALTPRLAAWDDVTNQVFAGSVPQIECDPSATYAFEKPGRYRAVVSDSAGNGGDEFAFALRAAPAEPGFEVYSKRSSFVFRAGQTKASFKVRVVRRNGFAGAVRMDDTDDFAFEGGTVPADSEEATVTVVAKRTDWAGMRVVSFTASGESASGRALKAAVTPGDEVQQAFAYAHILPARGFHMCCLPPDVRYAFPPEWPAMPSDPLVPPRIVLPFTNMPSVARIGAAALDAVAVDGVVPLAAPPDNAGDAVLVAKFASSAARTVGRKGSAAVDAGKAAPLAADFAVLAGLRRMVSPSGRHMDGDARRVRVLARAAMTPPDNDALLYMPSDEPAPLSGPVGAAARRLRDAGWCFDFATDRTLPAGNGGYRAVYVPRLARPMSKKTLGRLTSMAEKGGVALLFENALPKGLDVKFKDAKTRVAKLGRGLVAVGDASFLLGPSVRTGVRREAFAGLSGDLRFARYGDQGGEGWYFVHNAGRHPVSGNWRFAIRGNPRTAYWMDVGSGAVRELVRNADGSFACSLAPGGSAWVQATSLARPPADVKPPSALERRRRTLEIRRAGGGHGGGRPCATCHGVERVR